MFGTIYYRFHWGMNRNLWSLWNVSSLIWHPNLLYKYRFLLQCRSKLLKLRSSKIRINVFTNVQDKFLRQKLLGNSLIAETIFRNYDISVWQLIFVAKFKNSFSLTKQHFKTLTFGFMWKDQLMAKALVNPDIAHNK